MGGVSLSLVVSALILRVGAFYLPRHLGAGSPRGFRQPNAADLDPVRWLLCWRLVVRWMACCDIPCPCTRPRRSSSRQPLPTAVAASSRRERSRGCEDLILGSTAQDGHTSHSSTGPVPRPTIQIIFPSYRISFGCVASWPSVAGCGRSWKRHWSPR